MSGATGPDRLRAALRMATTRGTQWLGRGTAPLLRVGTPLPPALLGGELAELAGERMRALLRGETPTPATSAAARRRDDSRALSGPPAPRSLPAGASAAVARSDATKNLLAPADDDAFAAALGSFAPPPRASRAPSSPRIGSLEAAVRGYWAARVPDGAAAARTGAPLPDVARTRQHGTPLPPHVDGVDESRTNAAVAAEAPTAPLTSGRQPAPPQSGQLRPAPLIRQRASDGQVPAQQPMRAAVSALPAAFDDTLADALADLLREQALRDGVTLAW